MHARWIAAALLGFAGCGPGPGPIPPGFSSTLAAKANIEEIIHAVDPEAVVRGGTSGGGGGGTTGSFTGSTRNASWAYTFHGRVRSKVELGAILDTLRKELRADITGAGGKVVGQGGGPTTEQSEPGGPMRVLRTAESLTYEIRGYRGDLFLVAYPVSEPQTDYIVIVRAVEVLVDK